MLDTYKKKVLHEILFHFFFWYFGGYKETCTSQKFSIHLWKLKFAIMTFFGRLLYEILRLITFKPVNVKRKKNKTVYSFWSFANDHDDDYEHHHHYYHSSLAQGKGIIVCRSVYIMIFGFSACATDQSMATLLVSTGTTTCLAVLRLVCVQLYTMYVCVVFSMKP